MLQIPVMLAVLDVEYAPACSETTKILLRVTASGHSVFLFARFCCLLLSFGCESKKSRSTSVLFSPTEAPWPVVCGVA